MLSARVLSQSDLLLLLSRAGRNRRYGPWRGRNAPAAHQRRSTCTYYVRRAPYGGSLPNRRGFACACAPAGTAPRRRGRQNRGAREEAQMTPTFPRKGCPPRPREHVAAATAPTPMDSRALVAIAECLCCHSGTSFPLGARHVAEGGKYVLGLEEGCRSSVPIAPRPADACFGPPRSIPTPEGGSLSTRTITRGRSDVASAGL